MAKTVQIPLSEDVERVLVAMKRDYPALDYAEILKLGLSELYRKRESEAHKAWLDSLPVLEISEEEAAEVAETRKEQGRIMSIEEIMAEATKD